MLGISSRQGDDLLRAMTEPRLGEAGLCVPQKSLYVGLIWPLSMSQGIGSISWLVTVGDAVLTGRTIVNGKLCTYETAVSYKLAGVTGCRVPGGR